MIPSAILGRYSRSLAEIVFEQGVERKVTEDVALYGDIFRAVPDLLEVFHSPAVPRDSKERMLSELLIRYPVHPVAANFLRVLLQHNRIRYFEPIRDGYLKSVNERKGIVSAQVTAAVTLSADEMKKLTDLLAGITGKRVHVELTTDAGLLGGIVVQMGSTIFDGSIRTQLAEMKKRLAET